MRLALLALALLCAPTALAFPAVEPVVEGGDNDCEGTGEWDATWDGGTHRRWSRGESRCETRYSYRGVRVTDEGSDVASAGVSDREEHEASYAYDHHSELDWYACEERTCSDSRSYDNATDAGRWHRAQAIETSHTEPIEVAWCDGTSYAHSNDSAQHHGREGELLSRDTYHQENATLHESCRTGARTSGVEASAMRCDRDAERELAYDEHWRPGTGLTWDGEGSHRTEIVCLLGVWREVDAGLASVEVRAGYEETVRDCWPACGDPQEEALVARATVQSEPTGRAGVDERQEFDSPTRVMT